MKQASLAIAIATLFVCGASSAQDKHDDDFKDLFGPDATLEKKPSEPDQPAPEVLPTIAVQELPEQPTAAAATPARRGAQLEEIIVTAQKRAESLQNVPVSVSAFTSKELADISFNDVGDLTAHVPSLSVGTNVSPLSTSFRIRNVGKFSSIPSFEPAVGLFIDGAFRARSGLGLGDLVDVAAVEVIKGPQSTLYGKNVSAGVISVSTQAPTTEYEAMSEISVGSDALRQFKGYISGPITDQVGGRLSVISTKSGPFMHNLVGTDEDDRGSTAIRGQLSYTQGGLSSRLIVGYVDKDLHPKQGDVFVSDANIAIIRNAGGQVTNNNPKDRIVEYDGFNRFTLTGTDVIFNNVYQADGWSLTSISSYDEYNALSALHDVEQLSLAIADYDDTQKGRTFSQELRLDTSFNDRLRFLGGLYFLDGTFQQGDASRPEFILQDKIEELGDSIARYIARVPPILGPSPAPVPLIGVAGDKGNFLAKLGTRAYGIFSKFDFKINEAWDASLGLRYSAERKAGSLVQSYELSPLGCVPPLNANFICAVTPQDNNFAKTKTFSAVTGAFQTSYRLAEDFMVYGTVSTGFKSGGYSLQNGIALPELRPYGNEKIANLELGWKTEFLDNRARLNGAIFRTRYKDYQEASFLGLYFVVNSAESVSVTGMELDGELVITEHLSSSVSLEYVDSLYDTYTRGQCFYGRPADNADGQCNLSGQNLPAAYKLKGVASLSWESDFKNGSFYARGDYLYTGKNNSSSELDPRFDQPAFNLFNLKVGWRSKRLDFSLGGKNIFDQLYVDQSANANVLTPIDRAVSSPVGSYQNYIGSPRELTATLRLFFF